MKKSIFCFLFIILGVLLFVGCTNVTGTDLKETSASRAAVSQNDSSDQSESKTVIATESFTVRIELDGATNINNFLEGITEGSKQYYYSEDGFTGTLYSYKYEVVSAPYVEGGYRIFPVKVYYTGTVYFESSTLPESKTATATESFKVQIGLDGATNINNFLEGITEGSKQYYYSEDGFTGTLYSYKYDVVSAPYVEGGYRIFPVKVYYSGTVYKD